VPEHKERSAAQDAARQGDISLTGLLIGAAIVLSGIVLSLLASALITFNVKAPATGASRGAPPEVEGAPLQTAPPQDLKAYLREKNGRLASFGRVDAQHVHIPIERAMRILAKGRER
jgi:hypothetical protein